MEIDQDAMDVTCNGISNGNQNDVSTYKNKICITNLITRGHNHLILDFTNQIL